MILKTTYKDRPALKVESDKLIATFLYEDGAKLCSLVCKSDGRELMATKRGEAYRSLSYDGSYVNSECSAFDDMFPTIDPYTAEHGVHAGLEYPDHGECCRIPYECEIQNGGALLTAHSKRFGISYEKKISALNDGAIEISYRYVNETDEDFDFVWAGHIMLAGEDKMKLVTTFDENSPLELIFSDGAPLPCPMPRDTLIGFCEHGAAYKFYYTEPISTDGFSVVYADGRTLSFSYDKAKLPYFGVWLNNGEFQNSYTFTPEPCSVPFDAPDKALAKGYRSYIEPRGTFEFTLKVNIN